MKRKLTIQHDISTKEQISSHSTTLQISLIQWMAVVVLLMTVSCGPPPPRSTVNPVNLIKPTPSIEDKSDIMDTAYFIHEISNLKRLATFYPNEHVKSITSHDPNNGPNDAGFIRDTFEENNKTWSVLLEEEGPGVLTRFFFNDDLTGTVRIYVDYQKDPIIEVTFQQLYELSHELFQLYLSSPPVQSGGGFSSYLPITFKEHLTIMTDCTLENLKYQFDILMLPPDSPVVSFNGKLDTRLTNALTEHKEFISKNAIGRNESTLVNGFKSYTLNSGESKLIINDTGPAAISFFAIQIDPLSVESMENTQIKMYWDDLTEPAINTTLRDFFCANLGIPTNWNSVMMGFFPKTDSFVNGFYYCQYYMPFQKKGQILLENKSDNSITYKFARKVDFSKIPENFLYFYCKSHQQTLSTGLLYSMFEFEGKGKFAGIQISSSLSNEFNLEPKNFFYTGDPYYFIDGEEKASIIGSGLDNYFNGGKMFEEYTPFWMPTHGNLYNSKEYPYLSQAYRFHLLDAVPFSSSMYYAQEIGCPIQFLNIQKSSSVPMQVRWTCYWYGQMAETKVERNERVHYYSIHGPPQTSDPVMIDLQVYLQIPTGKWNLRYSPVYDLSQVFEQEYNVE